MKSRTHDGKQLQVHQTRGKRDGGKRVEVPKIREKRENEQELIDCEGKMNGCVKVREGDQCGVGFEMRQVDDEQSR